MIRQKGYENLLGNAKNPVKIVKENAKKYKKVVESSNKKHKLLLNIEKIA